MQVVRERIGHANGREASDGFAYALFDWARAFVPAGRARIGKARPPRRMKLIETLQLGGKRQLMLVACDGRRYLVGAGGDSVQSIAEMSTAIAESDPIGAIGEQRRAAACAD